MASTKIDDNSGTSGVPAPSTFGVWGDSNTGAGIIGTSARRSGFGIYGESRASDGGGLVRAGIGVLGVNRASGGTGIRGFGEPTTGTGVVGDGSRGVVGFGNEIGVFCMSPKIGLHARNLTHSPFEALLATESWAGVFSSSILVMGDVRRSGSASIIDHPLDPANKYLSLSSVESPERKNVYDGIAVLNEKGEAVVELPEWFGAVNRDFRCQLTCLGGHAPVFVAQKIEDNRFRIAGGSPGLEVSWQVTGNRQDPWANANPLNVEAAKSKEERGTFLHPELFGQPEEKSRQRALFPQTPEAPPQLKDLGLQEKE